MRLISQSFNGISRVLEKLFKYFNDTAISTFFVLLSAGFFLLFWSWVVVILILNDSDCVILCLPEKKLDQNLDFDFLRYIQRLAFYLCNLLHTNIIKGFADFLTFIIILIALK